MHEHPAWRDVEGFPGLYEVSDQGQVRSRAGRLLTAFSASNGYLGVNLSFNGWSRRFLVHRLVAQAFCAKPAGREIVNHKDGVKTNNLAANLEWCNASENMKHSFAVLGRVPVAGFSHGRSKPIVGVALITGEKREFPSARQAEREIGIAHTAIAKCCLGQARSTHGWVFSFA